MKRAHGKNTISESVQKYYPVFKEGDTEDAVNLIQRHGSIISNKKLRTHYSMCVSQIAEKKKAVKMLQAKLRKSEEDRLEIAATKVALKEYRKHANTIQEEAFDYFDKLLDQSLVPIWHDIVVEQCDTDG